jgi:hypothetical protein
VPQHRLAASAMTMLRPVLGSEVTSLKHRQLS